MNYKSATSEIDSNFTSQYNRVVARESDDEAVKL